MVISHLLTGMILQVVDILTINALRVAALQLLSAQ